VKITLNRPAIQRWRHKCVLASVEVHTRVMYKCEHMGEVIAEACGQDLTTTYLPTSSKQFPAAVRDDVLDERGLSVTRETSSISMGSSSNTGSASYPSALTGKSLLISWSAFPFGSFSRFSFDRHPRREPEWKKRKTVATDSRMEARVGACSEKSPIFRGYLCFVMSSCPVVQLRRDRAACAR
jgi:hypothetical protein